MFKWYKKNFLSLYSLYKNIQSKYQKILYFIYKVFLFQHEGIDMSKAIDRLPDPLIQWTKKKNYFINFFFLIFDIMIYLMIICYIILV